MAFSNFALYPDPDKAVSDTDVAFLANLFETADLLEVFADEDSSGLYERIEGLRRDFFASYKPTGQYSEWERAKFENAISRLVNDEWLMNNFNNWVKPRNFKDVANATEQYWLRQKAMQYIADHIRAEFGLSPIPVTIAVHPAREGLLGSYSPGMCSYNTDYMTINYSDGLSILDTPERALGVFLHELKHSIDDGMARDLRRGVTGEDHVSYQHSAVVALNGQKYVSPGEFNILGIIDWIGELIDYENQYVERVASDYADDFTGYFIDGIEKYRQENRNSQNRST